MKHILDWLQRNRKKAWFALGVNLLVMIGIFLLMQPFYETNDDLTMTEFINGSYAINDAHMVFIHYFIGKLLELFYLLPGRLPWYAAFQYGILWLSFSAVTYVLLQKLESAAGYCISGILLVYFAYEGYVKMQFSKVAGVAAVAGLLLLFYAISLKKLSVTATFCGILLCVTGSMYRFDEFAACTALMSGIGVYQILHLGEQKGKIKKILLRYVAIFGGVGVLTVGLSMYDSYLYDSNPLWNYYNEYNDARFHLMDYPMPAYRDNKELFASLDINENAYVLYKTWNFYDPDKFTIETMKTLKSVMPQTQLNLDLVKRFFKRIPSGFFGIYVFYGVLILLALWLVWGDHGWRGNLTALYEFLLFGGLYFYLFYSGRYLINRVDVGLWFAFSMVFIWMISGKKMRISWQAAAIIAIGLFLLNQNEWRRNWRFDSGYYIGVRTGERAILEDIASDKDHLYLAKVGTVSGGNSYGPFNRMAKGVISNICWLGGWEANAAGFLDTLHRYGVTNPYRDMIGNDQVYLIDHELDITMDYIHTYYDPDATAELVKEYGGGFYKVYKVNGGGQ